MGPEIYQFVLIIIPPSAIFLNVLFLQEIITMSELIGSLIIIFGLIILDGRILKNNFLNKIMLGKKVSFKKQDSKK